MTSCNRMNTAAQQDSVDLPQWVEFKEDSNAVLYGLKERSQLGNAIMMIAYIEC